MSDIESLKERLATLEKLLKQQQGRADQQAEWAISEANKCVALESKLAEAERSLEKSREHVRRAHKLLDESELADDEVIGGIFARAVNHVEMDAIKALESIREQKQ